MILFLVPVRLAKIKAKQKPESVMLVTVIMQVREIAGYNIPRGKVNRYVLFVFKEILFIDLFVNNDQVSTISKHVFRCWESYKNIWDWEFPGSLVGRTLCFHCRGPDSIPGQGTEIPQAERRGQTQNKTNKQKTH